MRVLETQRSDLAQGTASSGAERPGLLVLNSGRFEEDFNGLCVALDDCGYAVQRGRAGSADLNDAIRQCSNAKSNGSAAGIIATWGNEGPSWVHELASWAQDSQRALPLMLVVNRADPQVVSDLLRSGVRDFVTPPFSRLTLQPRIHRLIGERPTRRADVGELKRQLGLQQFVGASPALAEVFRVVPKVAASDVSVLISGETGTGKEVCARAIHYLSQRARKPFVPVNCGAIPVSLIENELFGHANGAYTGASSSAPGVIRYAAGGTLFLDEIDALPLGAQVTLLRFLQDGEVRPVGSTRSTKVDVRILSATNADLQVAVNAKTFRQDLYFRLNVVSLQMPPLRERETDIELLALHFLRNASKAVGKVIHGYAPDALGRMTEYDWPGNVRELENVVERAVVLCEGEYITLEDLAIGGRSQHAHISSFACQKAAAITRFEKHYLLELLQAHRGNVTHAAQAAGKHRRAFWALMRKHGISRKDVVACPRIPQDAMPMALH